jgi:hypothetical protein
MLALNNQTKELRSLMPFLSTFFDQVLPCRLRMRSVAR